MIGNVFPVVYSTLACEALIAKILPCYAIEAIASCQFWHRGLSDIYVVETQKKLYILRVSHAQWRSKSEIDFELELLNFLWQCQIPVASPLKTKDHQFSIEINAPEGKRYISLFHFAPGTVAVGDLNPVQAQKLGEVVAKLHQAATGFSSSAYRPPLTPEYLLDDPLRAMTPFLQHRPSDLSYLKDAIAQIKDQLKAFPQEPPFWSVCWGDPHSGNVHFTADNQVTLFDFDQCGYGWRAFEIAKFLQLSLSTGVSLTVRDAFLNGYQEVQALAACEISALQAFTQAAHIWAWGISLKNTILHNYCRLDDSYFLQRLQKLKRFRSRDWQLF